MQKPQEFSLKEKYSLPCNKDREVVIRMKNKALTLGATALVLGGLFMIPSTINAYRGDPNVEGPNHTEERHQEMEQAFENGDYQAWANLMQGKGRVIQVVNEGNFAQFAEAHRLAKEGDLEGSKQIRTELGLGLGDGSGKGEGQGSGQGQRMGR